MDTVVFSAWLEKLEQRLVNFIAEPSDKNEAALLLVMMEYREAIEEEYVGWSVNLVS